MEETHKLERGLSNRHIQLMAIGGAIGTGLFLGSGQSIALAGPSILFAYMITGGVLFLVMRALGEILLSNLNFHSFVDFTKEYLGERMAFLVGWTYWLCWVCAAMADLTAVGLYTQYWIPAMPGWLPGLIALAILVGLNSLSVKLFGEIEFWFAIIKIVAIIALILVGAYLIFTGLQYTSSNGEVIHASFSNIISRHGLFPKGIKGFLISFQMVCFAFAGIEMIGLTAGETADPEKSLPKAVNSIPIRIILFYVGALAIIMSIYPWDIVDPTQSPFVKVFMAAGIASAATAINFVVLTSAMSACNSAVFSTSRMVFSLAKGNSAPQMFKKVSKHKVPLNSLLFSGSVIGGAILINYFVPNASQAFVLISGVTTTCFVFIWGSITLSHYRYRKTRPELAKTSKFKMPLFPISSYVIFGFLAFIIVVLGVNDATRLPLLCTPIWFIILLIAYHGILKNRERKIIKNNNLVINK
ncbi:amino acid permease [Mycoplasma sp. P36-A1]|uniref:amino acid permease n=1 Tax=Mycoplasma sp. P36-A1 TaxID=3252900 RepID=UPI003C2C3A5E